MDAKLDVESPFKQIGANETGFAVKNYYDQINKHIEQGEYVIKQLKKLKLTKDQYNNIIFQAESATPPPIPCIKTVSPVFSCARVMSMRQAVR